MDVMDGWRWKPSAAANRPKASRCVFVPSGWRGAMTIAEIVAAGTPKRS
jgi:hypothetical protein